MNKNWVAQDEWGDWTAIPREHKKFTNREKIIAATEMREFVGWGYGFSELVELVRRMEAIKVNHFSGTDALDRSDGAFQDYWEEADDGDILAWVVR